MLTREWFKRRWRLLRRLEWLAEQGHAEARIIHHGNRYYGVLWRVTVPGKPVRVLEIHKRSVRSLPETAWFEQDWTPPAE
jgi:hypothetical protein